MTIQIKNAINSYAYDKVVSLLEKGDIVTPQILDKWEKELHQTMKQNDQKIGRNTVRELLVQYILSEFDVKAFGVESKAYQKHEISDKDYSSHEKSTQEKICRPENY